MQGSNGKRVLVPVEFHAPHGGHEAPGERIDVGGTEVWVDAANLAALRIGARVAQGGTMRLLHATPELTHVGVQGGLGAPWFPLDADSGLMRAAKVRATAVLRQLAEQCCPGLDVEIVVAPARAWRLVLADAEKADVDVIVLAVSGHGPVRRAALGSTADKVIRRAPCPVIVVPGPG